MKNSFKLLLYVFAVGLMIGCSREANVKSQFEEQKQVVNCLFENGKNFSVYTTLTGTPTDTNILGTDTNSIVILYENGVTKEIMPYVKLNAAYQSTTIAKTGVTYKLEVRNPKFSDSRYSVVAAASVPDSIILLNTYFKDSVSQDAFGNWMGKIHFEIADKQGMVNPELFIEYYDAQKVEYTPMLSFTPDNNWKKYASRSVINGNFTINNSDWNGATISFDLYVASIDYHINGLTQFRLSISNLSNDWRNYQTSLSAYIKSGGTDQLEVYSNIIGGYGIFAGKYVSRVIIK